MEIPQEVFDLYYETADDFIDSNFGVNCTFYYPETRVDCSNCIFDPLLKASSNKYQSGGPIPFTTGQCPYCNGKGYRSSVSTDTVKMRVYWEKKNWVKVPIPVEIKDGAVQCILHATDLPKLQRCTEVRIHADVVGHGDMRYGLAGTPTPHGFKRKKYFIAYMNLK